LVLSKQASIRQASIQLGLKLSTAKAILKKFKTNGSVGKKIKK
jgi:hypothetical protein